MPSKPPVFRPAHIPPPEQCRRNVIGSAEALMQEATRPSGTRHVAPFLQTIQLCAECERKGVVTPATVVHQTVPHPGNMVVFWDSSKWEALCVRAATTQSPGAGVVKSQGFGGRGPRRAFVCKIAKLNTKSPLRGGGGGSKVWKHPA
jgi:hypothetical protein